MARFFIYNNKQLMITSNLNPFHCADIVREIGSFCDKYTLKRLKFVTKISAEHVIIPTEGISIGFNKYFFQEKNNKAGSYSRTRKTLDNIDGRKTICVRIKQKEDKANEKSFYFAKLNERHITGYIRRVGMNLIDIVIQSMKTGTIMDVLRLLQNCCKEKASDIIDVNIVYDSEDYAFFSIIEPNSLNPRKGRSSDGSTTYKEILYADSTDSFSFTNSEKRSLEIEELFKRSRIMEKNYNELQVNLEKVVHMISIWQDIGMLSFYFFE
jgi:hypothetical protein